MAWRVADAARTFDSLTRPTPSRVHGPTEPPEPDVPRGASALLGASPRELLSVAVARMVFRRMLAPGLIVTSARYVLRCAGVPAEPYLGSLTSRHLLPATDHLSSLPRLLATVAAHYGDAAPGPAGLTDDLLFRLVRLAFLAYNYKSIGYRQGVHPDGPVHHLWFAAASDPAPRVWLQQHGTKWPMKNRHGAQAAAYYIGWDERLCANERAVVAAARQGEAALLELLNRSPAHGGIACTGATLVGTRIPAILTAAGVLHSPLAVGGASGAPVGGAGSQRAMRAGRLEVARYVEAAAASGESEAELRRLAGHVRALSDQDMADGLVRLLQGEPLLAHRMVRGVLPEALAPWCPAVIAVLPCAFTPASCEVRACAPLPALLTLLITLLGLPSSVVTHHSLWCVARSCCGASSGIVSMGRCGTAGLTCPSTTPIGWMHCFLAARWWRCRMHAPACWRWPAWTCGPCFRRGARPSPSPFRTLSPSCSSWAHCLPSRPWGRLWL